MAAPHGTLNNIAVVPRMAAQGPQTEETKLWDYPFKKDVLGCWYTLTCCVKLHEFSSVAFSCIDNYSRNPEPLLNEMP